jgi:hypothetical protein
MITITLQIIQMYIINCWGGEDLTLNVFVENIRRYQLNYKTFDVKLLMVDNKVTSLVSSHEKQ